MAAAARGNYCRGVQRLSEIRSGLRMGDKIAFSGAPADQNSALRVLDLKHTRFPRYPGPEDYSRSLVARWQVYRGGTGGFAGAVLFDFETQKWSQLATVRASLPELVRRWTICLLPAMAERSGRVKFESKTVGWSWSRIWANLPTTGNIGPWPGLGPDDSPLILKDIAQGTRMSSTAKSLRDKVVRGQVVMVPSMS